MICKNCKNEIADNFQFCPVCGAQLNNNTTIKNYDALVRRATKMVKEFDRYPLMPTGDLSIETIENVFEFNPLFVLDDLKKQLENMLLEQTDYEYDFEDLKPIMEGVYNKYLKYHKSRILDILQENVKTDMDQIRNCYSYYMDLRPIETLLFYYAFSIFYISQELMFEPGYISARVALGAINLLYCEKSDVSSMGMGFKHTGKMLNLSEFERDRQVYNKMREMIETKIEKSNNADIKEQLKEFEKKENSSSGGCYIATAVYGSYDCPQVWTLRRYRDYMLAQTWYGRAFIKAYYIISPTLVKWFGDTIWFKKMWEGKLDRMVAKLQAKGFESTPYNDKKR